MKRYTTLLLLIVCLGTGLRVYSLGHKSFWQDEGATAFSAEVLVPSLFQTLINGYNENWQQNLQQAVREWKKGQPSHPPLYFASIGLWMTIGRSEFILRFLSTLAGVVSIPMLYRLAKTLFNEKVGLLSALLLATSPLHIHYSQDARMYPLLTLFVLVSVYCVIGFLKTNAWAWRIGYVVCMTMNLYTHYITVFALAFQNIIVLIFVWQQRDKRRLLTWLTMQVCVLLLFVPWIPFALHQLAAKVTTGDGHSLPFEFPARLFATFSLGLHGGNLSLWMIAIGLLGFFIFFLYGLFAPGTYGTTRRKHLRWMTQEVAFCLTYLLSAALGNLLLSWRMLSLPIRLSLFGLPAYYMLVARGIERIRMGSKTKLAIIVVLIILLFFPIVTNIYRVDSQEDWRGVANYVLSKSQSEDIVVPHAYYTHKAFNYYAAGQISTYVDLVGVGDQPQNIPTMIQEAVQGHKRLWLILSHANYVDPDGAVKKYLDAHYRTLEEKHFQGTDGVFLYELRE